MNWNIAIKTDLYIHLSVYYLSENLYFYFMFIQIYPTAVRATGVGFASSIARFGGILCPLVAVTMVHSCHQTLAILIFELVMLLSGVAIFFFPFDTSGRKLSDHVYA
jgi:Sugar (and other) transporter